MYNKDDIFMRSYQVCHAMTETNNSSSRLSALAIREAMERVLSSQEFHDSDRLQAILRYVVEETLADRADGIKETTIAMEVFDRDLSEDSEHSSIVRVSAARLRRKLSYYYASSGQNDPIRIEIATGSYVPTPPFTKGSPPLPPAGSAPRSTRSILWAIASNSSTACESSP